MTYVLFRDVVYSFIKGLYELRQLYARDTPINEVPIESYRTLLFVMYKKYGYYINL